jgi:RNA polymerase sigma-70 factor (ECF subfamily)
MAVSSEQELLRAVRAGKEDAFAPLVEPYRGELHAHCYRMLGSVHDAEDAVQEALLRSWRGLKRFEGRSSLRSWLYTIATNACLNHLAKRPKRVLPVDYGPSWDPHDGVGEPVVESVWIEPYPDAQVSDGAVSPEARYEQRESVELAFVAALQHLPANQRAVLIMREVLGFSAQEAADLLETTPQSVNSALQRARVSVDEKLPDQSQQATLRSLDDDKLQEMVENYMDAIQNGDVDAVVAMLAEDAAWSMPPLASWFRGLDDVGGFLARGPMSGEWRWRRLATTANGQPAVAAYTWDEAEGCYLPFALDVITLEGDRIKEVTAFITRVMAGRDPEYYARFPDHALDPARNVFERFGLPARLRFED